MGFRAPVSALRDLADVNPAGAAVREGLGFDGSLWTPRLYAGLTLAETVVANYYPDDDFTQTQGMRFAPMPDGSLRLAGSNEGVNAWAFEGYDDLGNTDFDNECGVEFDVASGHRCVAVWVLVDDPNFWDGESNLEDDEGTPIEHAIEQARELDGAANWWRVVPDAPLDPGTYRWFMGAAYGGEVGYADGEIDYTTDAVTLANGFTNGATSSSRVHAVRGFAAEGHVDPWNDGDSGYHGKDLGTLPSTGKLDALAWHIAGTVRNGDTIELEVTDTDLDGGRLDMLAQDFVTLYDKGHTEGVTPVVRIYIDLDDTEPPDPDDPLRIEWVGWRYTR